MLWITEAGSLHCLHRGRVNMQPSQPLVWIENHRVFVKSDPEGRPIGRCPNVGVGIKPCMLTLKVTQGYSRLLYIDNHRVCLDRVRGLTDGTPPGVVEYSVTNPGQTFVSEKG